QYKAGDEDVLRIIRQIENELEPILHENDMNVPDEHEKRIKFLLGILTSVSDITAYFPSLAKQLMDEVLQQRHS
ncbi:unnamed protein product, partial [Didymodactylos carnosus]